MTTLRITMTATNGMGFPELLEPDTWETDAEQFIADNDCDDEESDILRTLPLGVGYNIGGGAGPLFTVERIS
jgi:hypothetical protein